MFTSYSMTTMPRLEAIQQVGFKRGECLFLRACPWKKKTMDAQKPIVHIILPLAQPQNKGYQGIDATPPCGDRGPSQDIVKLSLYRSVHFQGSGNGLLFFSWTKNNENHTSGDRLGSACGSHKRSLHLMLYAVHVSLVDKGYPPFCLKNLLESYCRSSGSLMDSCWEQ